jgi:hypothetical protein
MTKARAVLSGSMLGWIPGLLLLSGPALAQQSAGECFMGPASPVDPKVIPSAPCDKKKFPPSDVISINGFGISDIAGEKKGEFGWISKVKKALDKVNSAVGEDYEQGGYAFANDNRFGDKVDRGGSEKRVTLSEAVNDPLAKKNSGKFNFKFVPTKRIQCCKGQVTEKWGAKMEVEWARKDQLRTFYGVPYIGELGVRAVLDTKLSVANSLGLECEGMCFSPAGNVTGRLEAYGDVLSGFLEASAGGQAKGKAEVKLCTQDPTFQAKVELGSLSLVAEISAGWGLYTRKWEGPILTDSTPCVLYNSDGKYPTCGASADGGTSESAASNEAS